MISEDCVEHNRIFKSTWTEWQDRDGIYLMHAGSNSIYVGFCSQKEAEEYAASLDGPWKVVRWGTYKIISDEEIMNAVRGVGEYDHKIRRNRLHYGLYNEPIKYED